MGGREKKHPVSASIEDAANAAKSHAQQTVDVTKGEVTKIANTK
jgi:hypothetical protein